MRAGLEQAVPFNQHEGLEVAELATGRCVVRLPDGSEHDVVARVDGRCPPVRGTTVHLAPDPGRTHLFAPGDGRRLN